MTHIAIFASGSGTNAKAIIRHFRDHPSIKVGLIVTNNPEAGVIKIAHSNKIISAIISKAFLNDEKRMDQLLRTQTIDFIVLAGFLQYVPEFLLEKFPRRIINIHPALLPQHGGKGMFGRKVHEAVLANKESKTGITIHYVNGQYDAGEVIMQRKISVKSGDTSESLAARVLSLEHRWYPKIIEKLCTERPLAM